MFSGNQSAPLCSGAYHNKQFKLLLARSVYRHRDLKCNMPSCRCHKGWCTKFNVMLLISFIAFTKEQFLTSGIYGLNCCWQQIDEILRWNVRSSLKQPCSSKMDVVKKKNLPRKCELNSHRQLAGLNRRSLKSYEERRFCTEDTSRKWPRVMSQPFYQ